MATFGQRFKMLRIEKDMKQEELARDFSKRFHFNFTKSAISQYENDKRIPEIDALQAFAAYFNVTVDYLLGNSDIRNESEYINRNIVPSNIVLLKGDRSWEQFSQNIIETLDEPLYIRLFSSKRLEQIAQGIVVPDYRDISLLAMYAQVNEEFFNRINSRETLEEERIKYQLEREQKNKADALYYLSDEQKDFIRDKENLKYINFAIKLKQKGIDPDDIISYHMKV